MLPQEAIPPSGLSPAVLRQLSEEPQARGDVPPGAAPSALTALCAAAVSLWEGVLPGVQGAGRRPEVGVPVPRCT